VPDIDILIPKSHPRAETAFRAFVSYVPIKEAADDEIRGFFHIVVY